MIGSAEGINEQIKLIESEMTKKKKNQIQKITTALSIR